MIVLQIWMRGGLRWLALAILIHFAVNATVGILVLKLQLSSLAVDLVLVALAAAVLAFGWRLSTRSLVQQP